MAQRIKGQEVVLKFTNPQGDQRGLEDVLNFEAEVDIETLEEGYLGETANRYDDIYNGTSGTVELHLETGDYFDFVQLVKDRARRRDAASGKFSVTASFNFPNGERRRLTFEDIFFGPLPLRTPSRSEYVQVTLTWKCTETRNA